MVHRSGFPRGARPDRLRRRYPGSAQDFVDHDRHAIADAIATHLRRGKPARDLLYGDGRAGERIAECLAHSPLTIEKRLTY